MRKIEQNMARAINTRKNATLGNTVVKCNDIFAEVFLHGNHIADVVFSTGVVNVNVSTLQSFPTVTTKSRLRALGVDVCTKSGVTYLNGQVV